MVTPCPLIEVHGTPRERGVQHGRLAAERIRRGIAHYSAQLERARFGPAELRAAVAEYLPVIEAFDARYVDEMRGIAAGAEVDFEQIVLLNARTELLQIASRRAKAHGPVDDDPDGCTGLVVLPQASESGRLIHAQNWDWKAECAETAIVLKVRRDDGPDLLTFTEAGALGRCGFNAAGITITANYLESERDYQRGIGVPLALIRRKVLEQEHLALAMRVVYTTRKSASNNMIVSHAQGIVIDFECAPDESFQVHAQDGLLVHANHWQSPVALAKLTDTGILATPDSLYRDLRVRGLLEPRIGRIGRADVKAALFDDFASPWSVCRPPRPSLSENLSATVAMIVMEPLLGVMEVAMLPAQNREFSRFTLETTLRSVVPQPLPA